MADRHRSSGATPKQGKQQEAYREQGARPRGFDVRPPFWPAVRDGSFGWRGLSWLTAMIAADASIMLGGILHWGPPRTWLPVVLAGFWR